MRKIMLILLAVTILLLAGCGGQQPEPDETMASETVPSTEAPTEPPTEIPTEPKPTCINAQVQVDAVPAVIQLLNRGDQVEVVGEYKEKYYVICVGDVTGFVEKQLLRLNTEEAYEPWTGYAGYNAGIYASHHLSGSLIQSVKLNTKVEILDELDECYWVQINDLSGFMPKKDISKHYIAPYNGGSEGGGSNSGSGSSGGGQDGGDITLRYGIITLSATEPQGVVTGPAEVRVNGAQLILDFYNIGDTVSVVTEKGYALTWEGYHTLYIEGVVAYVPENLVLMEGEESFAQWEGFCAQKTVIYDNYLMQGEGKALKVNTEITVLWDGGDFYLVSTGDDLGYLPKAQVSETKVSTGGGYYDGGSSGGGGYVEEWSPPVL